MRAAVLSLVLVLSGAAVAEAQTGNGPDEPAAIVAVPGAIEWAPAPESLPEGADLAVIEGNPAESGEFTMRLRMPPNYRIPPHFHRVVEHVTVVQGTFHVGMGETFDDSNGMALEAGAFGAIPPGMRHFAWTEDDQVIIQLHGNGPWGIFYVNPEDDPRGAP